MSEACNPYYGDLQPAVVAMMLQFLYPRSRTLNVYNLTLFILLLLCVPSLKPDTTDSYSHLIRLRALRKSASEATDEILRIVLFVLYNGSVSVLLNINLTFSERRIRRECGHFHFAQ